MDCLCSGDFIMASQPLADNHQNSIINQNFNLQGTNINSVHHNLVLDFNIETMKVSQCTHNKISYVNITQYIL